MSDMQDTMLLGLEGIKKTILHGGTGVIPKLITGTKVMQAFTTLLHCLTQMCLYLYWLDF